MQRKAVLVFVQGNGTNNILCYNAKIPQVFLKQKEDPLNGFAKYCQKQFYCYRFDRRKRTVKGPVVTGDAEVYHIIQFVSPGFINMTDVDLDGKVEWVAPDKVSGVENGLGVTSCLRGALAA